MEKGVRYNGGMNKTFALLPMLGALACAPIACNPPTASNKLPCQGAEVILPSEDAPTTCDLNPPQVLSYEMHDPGPIQEQECLNHGGTPLPDLCYDIDY